MVSRPIALPALIADIGATNARFAFVGPTGAVTAYRRGPVASYATFEEAAETLALSAAPFRPRTAALAIAGAARGSAIAMTNCPWVVDASVLARRFGFEQVFLFNDWVAVALALPRLEASDVAAIGPPLEPQPGTRVAFGPGTGLGVAALAPSRCGWLPLASEGGHSGFGPTSAREEELWHRLEPPDGRVSAELLLCGAGLLRLRRAIAAGRPETAPPATPAAMVAAATARADPVSVEAVTLFAKLLGRFAGDLALVHLASALYLGGGVARAIAPFLHEGGFLAEFRNKAPQSALVRSIPTLAITNPDPAMIGLASFLRQPDSFAIAQEGWTA